MCLRYPSWPLKGPVLGVKVYVFHPLSDRFVTYYRHDPLRQVSRSRAIFGTPGTMYRGFHAYRALRYAPQRSGFEVALLVELSGQIQSDGKQYRATGQCVIGLLTAGSVDVGDRLLRQHPWLVDLRRGRRP